MIVIIGIDVEDNELLSLEIIHRYVEVLDKWFMNVYVYIDQNSKLILRCELDIIFNFQQAYAIIDEVLITGTFGLLTLSLISIFLTSHRNPCLISIYKHPISHL